MLFGTVGAFASYYTATENTFPVQLNGENVSIDGYNIDGSTYFKLRDVANVVGGFDVLLILFSFLKITINMIIKQIKLITVNIKEHMLF